MPRIYFLMILFLTFCLSACSEDRTPAYLMTHPKVLKQEFDACQAQNSDVTHCNMIVSLAQQFQAMEDMYQSDPQRFGMVVLNAEMDAAKAKVALDAARKSLADLQVSHASVAETSAAQAKITTAEKAYDEKSLDVATMLAVLSMTSPE